MRNTASERLDISINLNKLPDVEIRDERGITKLVIPIKSNRIVLTESGSVFFDMIAFPTRDNKFGATHAIKQRTSDNLRSKNDRDPILGSIYPHGRFAYNDELKNKKEHERRIKNIERERKQKYKGLDF